MTRRLVIAGAVAACAGAAPAEAATLVNSGGTLTYNAGVGGLYGTYLSVNETNDKTTIQVFKPRSDGDPMTVVSGCTDVTPIPQNGLLYRCDGVTALVLNGGPNDDAILAGVGLPMTISGGAGDDDLSGGSAADTLDGGPGDDRLAARAGDLVKGGSGIDLADYRPSGEGPVSLTLDGVANDGLAGEAINVMPDVEDVDGQQPTYLLAEASSSAARVTLVGSDDANALMGSDGNDTITGGGGADRLVGEAGDDTFLARDGFADRIECGAGTDAAVVDQFEEAGDSCESVQMAPTAFGFEDKPPTVAWVTSTGPWWVMASDDHAVAQVRFLDDDRVVCTDTEAPFTCAYTPRAADVGRNTLVAVATDSVGQTASAVRTLTVPRFQASAVSLTVTRRGRRHVATGKVTLPAGIPCAGAVAVRSGKTTRTGTLRRDCTFRVVIAVFGRPKFVATYRGSAIVESKKSKGVRART